MSAVGQVVLTKDGTYLTTDRLVLDGTAPVANIHLLMGHMRDDGAASITSFPTNGNLSAALNRMVLPADAIIGSGAFPEPQGANITLDVFNVTARAATDSIFRCLDVATAYAGVQNKLFKPNAYFYEFNRTYQLVTMNPNPNVCLPPPTSSKPLGDLNAEYFKCHSGEFYYTHGSIIRNGLPYRDADDLKFEQFAVDTWSSFARTFDPNPDVGFLKARTYDTTAAELDMAGLWEPIGESGLSLRRLQWPSHQAEFAEQEQCNVLSIPIDILA
jgi:hypothetical protein